MKLLTYTGTFLPAKLKTELLAAGVSNSWAEKVALAGDPSPLPAVMGDIDRSLVVQLREHSLDDPAASDTVEIGVPDDQDESIVAAVVKAHMPEWPAAASSPAELEAAGLSAKLTAGTATGTDRDRALVLALEAVAGPHVAEPLPTPTAPEVTP